MSEQRATRRWRANGIVGIAGLMALATLGCGGGAGRASTVPLYATATIAEATGDTRAAVDPTPVAQVSGTTQSLDALDGSIAAFLDSRPPQWGFAVYLPRQRTLYQLNGRQAFPLASLAKVVIMFALLEQHLQAGEELPEYEYALLESMIVYSDNDAGSILWEVVGRGDGLAAFLETVKISGIVMALPEFGWGDATATPVDMARLLALLYEESFLTADYRLLALDLLTSAALYQGWGAAAAFPAQDGVPLFGIKNGWYPAFTGWRVTSAALSRSPGLQPMVFVGMTRTQDSFEDAVQTIEGVAQRVGVALYGFEVEPFPPGEASGFGPTEATVFRPSSADLPRRDGVCIASAIALRDDAFRCEIEGGILDPCFGDGEAEVAVCGALPGRLEEAFAVPAPSAGTAASQPQVRPRGTPWFIELIDGATCVRTPEGGFDYDGEQFTYICDDGRTVVGALQRSATWWAFVEDVFSGLGTEVPVLRAWF